MAAKVNRERCSNWPLAEITSQTDFVLKKILRENKVYANKNSEWPEFKDAVSVLSTQIDRTDEAKRTFTVTRNNAR